MSFICVSHFSLFHFLHVKRSFTSLASKELETMFKQLLLTGLFLTACLGATVARHGVGIVMGQKQSAFTKETLPKLDRQFGTPDPACGCIALYDPVCCKFVNKDAELASNACNCRCAGGVPISLKACKIEIAARSEDQRVSKL